MGVLVLVPTAKSKRRVRVEVIEKVRPPSVDRHKPLLQKVSNQKPFATTVSS